MARRTTVRRSKRTKRKARAPRKARRFRLPRLSALLPSAGTRRRWSRWIRFVRRAPRPLQWTAGAALVATLWLSVNWTYQVVRKPSELLFPVSGTLYKTPAQTWRSYAPSFRRHATEVITPDFLAALAQVEGSGNPVVRTYWRWALSFEPFEIYRPASSAVGMYQITDGTFAEARRYCIHDHEVAEDGAWHDWRSCWFNALYTRVVPSHAIEMTAAYLDRQVDRTLQRQGIHGATLAQKQALAAVIHLCGAGAAAGYARRGLRPAPGQRCGAHVLAAYLDKVDAMQEVFARLAADASGR